MKRFILPALLASCVAVYGQSLTCGKVSFAPTPGHDYVDLLQSFSSCLTNTGVTATQLGASVIGGAGTAWANVSGNATNGSWFCVSNTDLAFPRPVRVGSILYPSTGPYWIKYYLTNGAEDDIRCLVPQPGFGESIYTNMTCRGYVITGVTNSTTTLNNLDLLEQEGGPASVFQLQTQSSVYQGIAHAVNGVNGGAVALTNFVPYYFTLKRVSPTNGCILTIQDTSGNTIGTSIGQMETGFGSSWVFYIKNNYLNLGNLTGWIMFGGISIAYTYE